MDKVQLQNRTKCFAIRVFKTVEKLPKSKGTEVIAYQLIKASSSVAAHYRAVCRAKSRADFINKLKIVEEEADESLFWLEFISDLELIHQPPSLPARAGDKAVLAGKKLLKNLIKEANELVSIFTAALKTSRKS